MGLLPGAVFPGVPGGACCGGSGKDRAFGTGTEAAAQVLPCDSPLHPAGGLGGVPQLRLGLWKTLLLRLVGGGRSGGGLSDSGALRLHPDPQRGGTLDGGAADGGGCPAGTGASLAERTQDPRRGRSRHLGRQPGPEHRGHGDALRTVFYPRGEQPHPRVDADALPLRL